MTPEHTVVVVPQSSNFGSTLASLLVVIVLTCAAIFFFMKHRKIKEEQMTFEQLQSIIYEEVQDVYELALVRENFKSTVSVDVDKKIPFLNVHMPGTSRKFLMDYSGTIVCGFDLSGVQVLRDGTFGNKVKVILPSSKILDIYADVNSFNIHLQDAGILASNIKIEEQNAWVAADVAKHGRQAVQEGLLLRADDNAQKLLLSRINNRGLNQSFDLEVLTLDSGDVRQLNPPQ
ncbi:MAG: DUF4230 domain-containing protein [Selenomonadaceae bacterium]|nr:DUF4230 domain-containing protein [Selenomonadaceae bacterium]